MRLTEISLLVASLATGCMADGAGGLPPQDPLPVATGSYVGTYRVPTTDALTTAATFPITHVDWTVVGGVVTLDYALPDALVGGALPITLSGALTTAQTSAVVTGEVGMGTCTAAGTVITCHEQFANLGALPISMAVVQQLAIAQYAGPVADRVAVALGFSSDPIGFVSFDLAQPYVDDHGGGKP
jgi:hypothetical protein